MATLYFRYGCGKTADLCQTAYNYQEIGKGVICMNAKNNEEIVSKVQSSGQELLRQEPNYSILEDTNLFKSVYFANHKNDYSCILVDNAEYLTEQQALEIFYITKVLNIPVICYANRVVGEQATKGAMRLMELADTIEPVDSNLNASLKAKLHFYYGAMNCSKTAKLLYKADFLERQGLKVCLIKPESDRDAFKVKSRIGLEKTADMVVQEKDRLYGEGQYLYQDHINHILVDEAQFLSIEQINDLYRITRDYNIPVSCYGLKTDFQSHHFTGSGRLLEIADAITKMRTVCVCGEGANFNGRQELDGTWIKEGEQVVIDNGGCRYIPLCPEHYLEYVWGIDSKDPKALVKKM